MLLILLYSAKQPIYKFEIIFFMLQSYFKVQCFFLHQLMSYCPLSQGGKTYPPIKVQQPNSSTPSSEQEQPLQPLILSLSMQEKSDVPNSKTSPDASWHFPVVKILLTLYTLQDTYIGIQLLLNICMCLLLLSNTKKLTTYYKGF